MVLLFSVAMAGNAGIIAMLPLFFVTERSMELASANTLIGLSQLTGLLAVFFAGVAADRVGPQKFMAAAIVVTGILTMAIGCTHGTLLVVVLFLQPAVLTAFFPAAFAALSRIAPPAMRSVTSALGPPLAYLFGAGLMPVVIGHMAGRYSIGAGIIFAGGLMIAAPIFIFFLKLGEFDSLPGC